MRAGSHAQGGVARVMPERGMQRKGRGAQAAGAGTPRTTRVEPAIERLLGTGADGTSYAIRLGDGTSRELWRVRAAVVNDALRRRLKTLESLDAPSLLPLHRVGLDNPIPALEVGDGETRWAPDLADRPLRETLRDLSAALAAAHQLDVVHGYLGIDCVGIGNAGALWLDLTTLRVRAPANLPLAPELATLIAKATPAADVWALGHLASAWAEGAPADLRRWLERMTAEDPEARPHARQVHAALCRDPATTTPGGAEGGLPARVGAYELGERIGAGGAGRVYRARDVGGGPDVAVKILHRSWSRDEAAVTRFRREARVLSQLQSPYVTRYVAANVQDGLHYLVMELVDAESAMSILKREKRVDVDVALAIACDVSRALSEMHGLGLVHRDVKPSNILVRVPKDGPPEVKLCDFGIARGDADASVTKTGTLVGTPTFMSPEQVLGTSLGAPSDVYSLGASLYMLLAGRPPFSGAAASVMIAHVKDLPEPVTTHRPSVPRPISAVVERCLEKEPTDRYPDANALLEALMTAWRGDVCTPAALPQPIHLQGEPLRFEFQWQLRSTPDALWPHVSNTERLNCAAGLDDVDWVLSPGEGYVRTQGSFRAAGMQLRWTENPFEWVAPRRLGVVREYSSGPFEWLRNTVTLDPREGGGTLLTHRIEIRPRGLVGRVAANVEVGLKLRRAFAKVYRQIDESRALERAGLVVDPFDPDTHQPPRKVRRRVGVILSRLKARGADPLVAEKLTAFVSGAPAERLGRIRPRVFAEEHGFSPEPTITAFLLAAAEGLLLVQWDILCPRCRISCDIEQSLSALKDHGGCAACDLEFEIDLARSVELVFRAHPSIRDVDLGVYCIGGPAHSPHVLSQVRLLPGARFKLPLNLEEGRYQVAARGVSGAWPFTVRSHAPLSSWDLPLREGEGDRTPRILHSGHQELILSNELPHELLVRVELTTSRQDAVTAADAATNATFRDLFPDQVLSPGRLISASDVALLFVQLPEALARYRHDEALMHSDLTALSNRSRDAAEAHGGALVRVSGDSVMAAFLNPEAALRAALQLAQAAPDQVALALHLGAAQMVTVGGHLDYFGRTLYEAEQLVRAANAGELLLSERALAAPDLADVASEELASIGQARVATTVATRMRLRRTR